jgi:hypothetical protein
MMPDLDHYRTIALAGSSVCATIPDRLRRPTEEDLSVDSGLEPRMSAAIRSRPSPLGGYRTNRTASSWRNGARMNALTHLSGAKQARS